MPSIPVLTPAQAADWDAAAVAAGRPLRMLMETAGRAVANAVLSRHGATASRGVLIACGTGNNGGDGWVAARTLHALGIPVWATETSAAKKEPAIAARNDALNDGVQLIAPDGPWPQIHLTIDALLGGGAEGPPNEITTALLHRIASFSGPVVAVDGPSGLDLSTGVDHGALTVDTTVTFGGVRRGHLLARDDVGTVVVAEIGLPNCAAELPLLVTRQWAAKILEPFAANAHKGNRGRVVIVGGNVGMSGAARLASRAAFAAGAGLVHAVVPPTVASDLAKAEPDVQVNSHDFGEPLSHKLSSLIASADTVIIGPGLGREANTEQLVIAVLRIAQKAVVDADALTVMAHCRSELGKIAADTQIVITPHPGEFRTLFSEHAALVETDPWAAAAAAANEMKVAVLLKGVPTVIAHHCVRSLTVASGNPGLATGGSGDVLSGIVGALMASGTPPMEAAAVAAQALGEAADTVADTIGARSMRPMDVVAELPNLWSRWRALPAIPDGTLYMLPKPAVA